MNRRVESQATGCIFMLTFLVVDVVSGHSTNLTDWARKRQEQLERAEQLRRERASRATGHSTLLPP